MPRGDRQSRRLGRAQNLLARGADPRKLKTLGLRFDERNVGLGHAARATTLGRARLRVERELLAVVWVSNVKVDRVVIDIDGASTRILEEGPPEQHRVRGVFEDLRL